MGPDEQIVLPLGLFFALGFAAGTLISIMLAPRQLEPDCGCHKKKPAPVIHLHVVEGGLGTPAPDAKG